MKTILPPFRKALQFPSQPNPDAAGIESICRTGLGLTLEQVKLQSQNTVLATMGLLKACCRAAGGRQGHVCPPVLFFSTKLNSHCVPLACHGHLFVSLLPTRQQGRLLKVVQFASPCLHPAPC